MAQAKTIESADLSERIDPELVALPAAPAGRRLAVMTVMALAVAMSLAFLFTLRLDIAYFFADDTAHLAGEAVALDVNTLTPNTFVTVSGTPMASGMVRYSRASAEYAVFPLAGQRNVFVQVEVHGDAQIAQREFTGRLVTVGDLGSRFSSVSGYLNGMGIPVSSESMVLLADEPPGTYGWALLLAALCLLFVLVNIVMLLRWFRPLGAAS